MSAGVCWAGQQLTNRGLAFRWVEQEVKPSVMPADIAAMCRTLKRSGTVLGAGAADMLEHLARQYQRACLLSMEVVRQAQAHGVRLDFMEGKNKGPH